MKITIGNESCDRDKITYRDLGFGQFPDLPLTGFQLHLSFEQFVEYAEESFDEFSLEMREDYKQTGDPVPVLSNYSFPSFRKLWNTNKDDLCYLVRRYLFFELLEEIFGSNEPAECLYSINSIDNISLTKSQVIVEGLCYKIESLR